MKAFTDHTLLSTSKRIKSEHLDETLRKESKSITDLQYTDLLFMVVFYPVILVMRVKGIHNLLPVSVLTTVNVGTDDTFINDTVTDRILVESMNF